MSETRGLVRTSLGPTPLLYGNEPGSAFQYVPASLHVWLDGATLRRLFGPWHMVHLLAPPGWTTRREPAPAELGWVIEPSGPPPSCRANLHFLIDRRDGRRSEVVYALPITIQGRSQFDPDRHALPYANSSSEFGETPPSATIFGATYRRAPLRRLFYAGLYHDVVFLTGDPAAARPGGLCTGIARSTLEFSLTKPAATITAEPAAVIKERVAIWHGKQLADRALLASTWAWLSSGSRDAYQRVRRDLLRRGLATVALDVNVPRLWRRDILTAFVGEGHTVVPYALRQTSDDRAEVWVYDPNHCRPGEMAASVIEFDLANDTYRYRHFDGQRAGRPSKVLAVGQDQYRAADTALLGPLLSLLLALLRWWTAARSARGRAGGQAATGTGAQPAASGR